MPRQALEVASQLFLQSAKVNLGGKCLWCSLLPNPHPFSLVLPDQGVEGRGQHALSLARCDRVTAVAEAARRAPAPDGPAPDCGGERSCRMLETYHNKQMCRQSALGVLLGVILVFSQAGSAAAYACTADSHCKYSGCDIGWPRWGFCPYGHCIFYPGGPEKGSSQCHSYSCVLGCADPPVCDAGTFSADGKNAGGDKACQQCPPGKFSTATGSTVCTSCGAGKFSAEAGAGACNDCEAGKYQAAAGSAICDECEAGKHNPLAGVNIVCDECQAGTWRQVCSVCDRSSFYCSYRNKI